MSQCAYAIFAGDTRSSSVRRECSSAMVAAKPAGYLNVPRSPQEVVLCPGFSSEVRCPRGRVLTAPEPDARDAARAVDSHITTSVPSGESTRKEEPRYGLGSKNSRQSGGGGARAPLKKVPFVSLRFRARGGGLMRRGLGPPGGGAPPWGGGPGGCRSPPP